MGRMQLEGMIEMAGTSDEILTWHLTSPSQSYPPHPVEMVAVARAAIDAANAGESLFGQRLRRATSVSCHFTLVGSGGTNLTAHRKPDLVPQLRKLVRQHSRLSAAVTVDRDFELLNDAAWPF